MEDSPSESFEPLKTLDLPHVPARVVEPESFEPTTSESPHSATEPVSSPVPASVTHESVSSPVPASVTRNFPRFSQVYSRRKAAPELTQVQESNSDSRNEITVRSNPPLHTQYVETSTDPTYDLALPIAIRKGFRECTKQPIYPLSHYVSLKRLSPIHKKFIVSLNTIAIPNTVSEAFSKREWSEAMRRDECIRKE